MWLFKKLYVKSFVSPYNLVHVDHEDKTFGLMSNSLAVLEYNDGTKTRYASNHDIKALVSPDLKIIEFVPPDEILRSRPDVYRFATYTSGRHHNINFLNDNTNPINSYNYPDVLLTGCDLESIERTSLFTMNGLIYLTVRHMGKLWFLNGVTINAMSAGDIGVLNFHTRRSIRRWNLTVDNIETTDKYIDQCTLHTASIPREYQPMFIIGGYLYSEGDVVKKVAKNEYEIDFQVMRYKEKILSKGMGILLKDIRVDGSYQDSVIESNETIETMFNNTNTFMVLLETEVLRELGANTPFNTIVGRFDSPKPVDLPVISGYGDILEYVNVTKGDGYEVLTNSDELRHYNRLVNCSECDGMTPTDMETQFTKTRLRIIATRKTRL